MAMSDNEAVKKEEVLNSEAGGTQSDGVSTDTPVTSHNNNTKDDNASVDDQFSKSSIIEEHNDDAISQSNKSSGMFLSSSESAFASSSFSSTTSTSVTQERKQILLAQARADRLDWIRKVPLPYKCESARDKKAEEAASYDAVWERNPRLAELKKTFVFQQSPSAVQVLSHLYGMTDATAEALENNNETLEAISERVGAILDQVNEEDGDDDGKLAVPTAEQIRSTALAEEHNDPVLRAYHSLVSKLADPAAAVLVQGMRGFCKKIRKDAAETLPPKLQGYMRLTYENLGEYIPWKETEINEDTRRSLESFLYGHLADHIDNLYWTDVAQDEETKWQERLSSLQFVTPKHLEISCLVENEDEYKELFTKPVEALVSVDKYFSPFEKLQRILSVYHYVNAALTGALNKSNESGAKKLPSADDVLPSIILTVLLARPTRLLYNLQIIEDFSPQEHLRGEAGYAYTNLYGAVQFLKDIDLDADKPGSLHIEAEEFRKNLQACREAAESKHAQRRMSKMSAETIAEMPLAMTQDDSYISVAEVRAARMQGETIDIEWAKQRLGEIAVEEKSEETNGKKHREKEEDADELPAGFTRSYTFLSSRPEDIKISDLPKLLAEYKMLVHTTEALIGEKITKANAEKKKKLAERQKEVYAAASQIDPSLLPPVVSPSKRRLK